MYLGDTARVPYGPKSPQVVRDYTLQDTDVLLEHDVKMIVVACNTASAAALHFLREKFPTVPFVGMEPAVKPAAELTHTRVVGVLATPATFQGDLYTSVVERFASGVTLLQATCPGLVSQIEKGDLEGPETRRILEQALLPMLAQNIDTIVLGCTHYPFVIPLIQQIAGPGVRVIDPAPAIARQTVKVLQTLTLDLPTSGQASVYCFTSAQPDDLQSFITHVLNEQWPVEQIAWRDSSLNGSLGKNP